MVDFASFLDSTAKITAAVVTFASIALGAFTFRGRYKIKQLKQEIEYLKKKVHRVTSTVDPESDRRLIESAEKSIQILGINALGPLHHAREAMIKFLRASGGILHIVLLDPESTVFRDREEHERDGFKRILTEWKASLTILMDIKANSKGHIEIKLRSDPPDRSLLIIDAIGGPETKSKMLINYYPEQSGMRGYSGAQFLSEYVAERDRDSFFRNTSYFDQCWQESEPTDLDILFQEYVLGKDES